MSFTLARVAGPLRVITTGARRGLHRSPCVASMWPQSFQDPVLDRNQFKELRATGEFERLLALPIKAAPFTATCSVFHDPLMERFIRVFMREGKRETFDRIMIQCCQKMKQTQLSRFYAAKTDEARADIDINPIRILKRAVANASPLMNLQEVQIGSVVYQVPIPILQVRAEFEGIRWIISAADDRPDTKVRIYETLADTILETAMNKGPVIAKKNEQHRICEVNRAYAHFRSSA